MAKIEEYLSQSKYVEHRNVTKSYIARLIKEGRSHLIKGKLNVGEGYCHFPIHYDEEYFRCLRLNIV